MFVKKVEFDVDAHIEKAFPKALKGEVGFIGRSNVGKSSLLNALFGRKLAKISSTPGKTRSLIFFKVNNSYYFVDFPGYGYAKSSKTERNKWERLINNYFNLNRPRRAIFLLIDSRIPIQLSDLNAFEWLISIGEKVAIVPTKIDKLKKAELLKKIADIEKAFYGADKFLPVSSVTKNGLKALDAALCEYLTERIEVNLGE